MKFKYIMLVSGLLLAGAQMQAATQAQTDVTQIVQQINATIQGVNKVITEDLAPTILDISTNVSQFKTEIALIDKTTDSSEQITRVATLIDDLQVTITRLGEIVVDLGTDVVAVWDKKAAGTTTKIGTVIKQLSDQISNITSTMKSIAVTVKSIENALANAQKSQ